MARPDTCVRHERKLADVIGNGKTSTATSVAAVVLRSVDSSVYADATSFRAVLERVDVSDGITASGDHRGEVDQDPAPVVTWRETPPGERA